MRHYIRTKSAITEFEILRKYRIFEVNDSIFTEMCTGFLPLRGMLLVYQDGMVWCDMVGYGKALILHQDGIVGRSSYIGG